MEKEKVMKEQKKEKKRIGRNFVVFSNSGSFAQGGIRSSV
jgi:hypothetical protein